MDLASQPSTMVFTPAHSAPTARSAPTSAARAPSSIKGSWIKRFDAPTSLIMPVSLDRLMADRRIVVEISRTAATAMTAARPPVIQEARFMTRNRGSRVSLWSTTRSTPSRPANCSATTWYFSGSWSLIRKETGIIASVALRPIADLP